MVRLRRLGSRKPPLWALVVTLLCAASPHHQPVRAGSAERQAPSQPLTASGHYNGPSEQIEFSTVKLSSGEHLSTGRYRYSTVYVNSEERLRQTGELQYAGGNHGLEVAELAPSPTGYRPCSYRLEVFDPRGRRLRQESLEFNASATQVRVFRHYDDPSGREDSGVQDQVDKLVSIPPETYARQMFDALLRGMDFRPGERRTIHVITRLGDVYGIILHADQVERVKVAAGSFEAQRFRLIPDIPLLPILMPSLTMRLWYTRQAPHLPLKFEGYPQPPPPRFQDEVRLEATSIQRLE